MNTVSPSRPGVLVATFVAVAIVSGFILPRLAPEWFVAGFLGAVALAMVVYDYRVGTVCLTLLLPWSYSSFVPQTHGFNLINFLVAATTMSLILRRVLRREHMVMPPGVFVWCYVLPFVLGVALAFPNLVQARANYPLDDMLQPLKFLIGKGIKPFFYVVYAVLLANALRDSKKPELFLVAFAIAAILPCLLIIQQVLAGADVTNRKGFMAEIGLHPNSYGILLTSCLGPLLFIAAGSGPRGARAFSAVAVTIVSVGMLLTASRGAALAFLVVVGIWMWRRRKATDLLLAAAALAVLVMLLPDQVLGRFAEGLDTIGRADHTAGGDRLTMGRGYIWGTLAPDVLLSPLWGHGLGSTAWNTATNTGRNLAGHPHNLYLLVLLDIGVLGLAAVLYLFYRVGATLKRLSVHPSLSPLLRDFCLGASVSLIALLVFYFTNGYWWPEPEQTFWWFTLGVTFAFWELANATAEPRRADRSASSGRLRHARPAPFGRGAVRHRTPGAPGGAG